MFQLLAFYVILFSCRGFFEGTGGEEVPNGDKALNVRVTRGNGLLGMFTGDNSMQLYADGRRIGHDNKDWTRATKYAYPKHTRVIAIKAVDGGVVGGLLGAVGNGIVTDERWKCTHKYHHGWASPHFNDAAWPNAHSYGSNGARPWKVVAGIPRNARWIWTNNNVYGRGPRIVWCRRHLRSNGLLGMFTGDNSMQLYADGRRIGQDNGDWTRATAYSYPKHTRVIAIKAIDGGVVGGLLGAVGNGIVTDERWKCTHKYQHGWTSPHFNDAAWPNAHSYGSNGARPWKVVAGIPHNARWIWTNNNVYGRGPAIIWCRRHLRSEYSNCSDSNQRCGVWASLGYCRGHHQGYMSKNCKKSCKLCGSFAPPGHRGR